MWLDIKYNINIHLNAAQEKIFDIKNILKICVANLGYFSYSLFRREYPVQDKISHFGDFAKPVQFPINDYFREAPYFPLSWLFIVSAAISNNNR